MSDFEDPSQLNNVLALKLGGDADDNSSVSGLSRSRRGQRIVDPFCIMPRCDDEKKNKSKFCRFHSCHLDNLKHAASKESDAQKEAVAEALKDDGKAVDMIAAWSTKNVASGLFKGNLVDWAEWNSRFGLRTSIIEGTRTVPFEKTQFVLRQKNKFGRTDEEAVSMWNEREAEGWKRDRKGYRGCLRLWLPKGEFIDRQQERFIDEGAQEGSSRKKKIRDSDRDALRVHVGELDTSFGHEFFANQSTLALASGSGGSTAEQEEQDKRGNISSQNE